MASTIYKDHLIVSYAVLNTETNLWHPRLEITLPDDHCSPCGTKTAAEKAGIEVAKLLIDNARKQ